MPPIKKKSPQPTTSTPAKSTAQPPPFDPGEAAYEQLRGRLALIPAERVTQPRTDVRTAATFVLSDTAPRLKDAALQARFAGLLATDFDHSALVDLIPAAQAALWAQVRLATDEAGEVSARLPAELVDECSVVRTRMLELCAYHFKDDPKLRLQVEDIRSGSGYLDMAEDLSRLAALYNQHHELLVQDLRFYRATDAPTAVALAQRMTSELRLQPGRAQTAREVAWRTWALLQALYAEVSHAAHFLLREAGEAAFPLLHTVGRSRRRSARPPEDAT